MEKARLRAEIRKSPVDANVHTPRIRESILSWLRSSPGLHRIAVFHPLPDEPDLLPLATDLTDRIWLFPRIDAGDMSFHPVRSPEHELVPGHYGILEPAATIPAAPPESIDLFLCPGLAFDPVALTRLGRGKGYYDRYLAMAGEHALFAGVAFPSRIVSSTHPEPHDIRMHRIFC